MSESNSKETQFDDESIHVGQVYAKALLAAAQASGNVELVVAEFDSLVHDVMNKQPSFEAALANPKLATDDKIRLLDNLFSKKMDPTLLKFLKVLATRRRFGCVRSVYQSVSNLRDEATGKLRIIVTTALPVDASTLDTLKTKLSSVFKKDVVISTRVDASVIGGLLIRVGDVVFDGSVDGQLKLLKSATIAKAEQAIRDKLSTLAS
jgi:F-type H+-transporting ATPase subunit delta